MKVITVVSYRLFDIKVHESDGKVKGPDRAPYPWSRAPPLVARPTPCGYQAISTVVAASPLDTALVVAHTVAVAVAVKVGNRPLHLPGRPLVSAVVVDTLARKADTAVEAVVDKAGRADTAVDTAVVAAGSSSQRDPRQLLLP